jgi:CubicO group peptidase (beta-lactamase class C family)
MIYERDVRTLPEQSRPLPPQAMSSSDTPWLGSSHSSDTISWTESDSIELNLDTTKLSAAVNLVQARGTAAQLCVIRYGQVVLDRYFGCGPRSLFWIFSASKPYVAVLIHLLADRRLLSLDDPVSAHWPEFAAKGKGGITIRHVLQHRSGLAAIGTTIGDVLTLADWSRFIRRIENAEPRRPAGEAPAYQPLVYGFILGELVQRVTGKPVAEVLATELLRPLEAHDTYLGLPNAEWDRHVPIVAPGLRGLAAQAIINRKSTRRAIIPAAGISTTARDLARFYFMLLRSGSFGGVRILSVKAIENARVPSNDGEIDRTANLHIRWSNGFQLGGPRPDPESFSPLGQRSSPRAFGHNGSNCCIGWADPDRHLVFTYLTNRLNNRRDGASHLAAVADAVISACF